MPAKNIPITIQNTWYRFIGLTEKLYIKDGQTRCADVTTGDMSANIIVVSYRGVKS